MQGISAAVVQQPVPGVQRAMRQNVARMEEEAERLSSLGSSLDEELRRLSRSNSSQDLDEVLVGEHIEIVAELSHQRLHQQPSAAPPNTASAPVAASKYNFTRPPFLQQQYQQISLAPSFAFRPILSPPLSTNSAGYEKIKTTSSEVWPRLPIASPFITNFGDTSTSRATNMAAHARQGVPILSLANPLDFAEDQIVAGELTPRAGQSPVDVPQLAYPGVNYSQQAQFQPYVLPDQNFDGQFLSPGEQYHGPDQDRPSTAASADTYQQAQTLFEDFDGAHYAPSIMPSEAGPSNRLSSMLRQPPPLNNRGVPPPADGMVFYPAPVPMSLNLPQRLSKALPQSVEAKRRTQMLSTLAPDARKSAIWLNDKVPNIMEAAGTEDPVQMSKRMSMLPPQLRASMFFENPTSIAEVKVRDKSAMATLEDLLDASTTAPVSAFTDHPFAGKVGSEVYKRTTVAKRVSTLPDLAPPPKLEKRRSSFLGFRRMSVSSTDLLADAGKGLKKRGSRAFSMGARLDDAHLSRNSSGFFGRARSEADALSDQEDLDLEDEEEEVLTSDEDEDTPLAQLGPPTTLLAELQLRKEEQKKRNRTALTSFPNGMHSTLLEMDAVAQIQKKKRQTARITLAWEDPDHVKSTEKQAPEDEDVPLGVLYAAKGKVQAHLKERGMGDWDRPLGLIELREREDNEPLSFRRARLKGIDPYAPREPSPQMPVYAAPVIQIDPENDLDLDEEPEESLADRKKRLNSQKELGEILGEENVRVVSQAFSADLNLEALSINGGSREKLENVDQAPTDLPMDEEEETLGQRRARLQKMAQQQSQLSLRPEAQSTIPQARPALNRASTSLADLLHSVPLGATRKVSDKDLIAGLPQDSLLKQSENMRTARKGALLQNQAAYTQGTYNAQGTQQFDNRSSMAFRGGAYNNGFGGVNPAGNQPQQPLMNVRQSMYSMAAQSQLNLFGASNPMMAGYQNNQMGMSGNTMSMYPGMIDPMIMNQLQTLQSMNAASTPNLLGNEFGAMPQQRHSSFMGMPPQMQMPMPMNMPMQQGMGMADGFMDTRARTRIDAWRQSVQMD